MNKRHFNKAELLLFAIPFLIACVAWWMSRSQSTLEPVNEIRHGVMDLGLLTVDNNRMGMTQLSPVIASRALSKLVQRDRLSNQFIVKWRYPNPAPGWAEWVLIYQRRQGTLEIECSLSTYGPQAGSKYGQVSDAVLAQVANHPDGSLLDWGLLQKLGCKPM